MPDTSTEDVQGFVDRMERLLTDIDTAGLQPASIMTEAEGRLLEEHNRPPRFSTAPGRSLATLQLDTQYLRWWIRGTDAGLAMARISDDQIVDVASRAEAMREAALDRVDQYADDLAELVIREQSNGDE